MTPTVLVDPRFEAIASHGFAGADAFLTLLATEIAPTIEQRHGLSANGRGIGGWSLGGLLTCYALLTRPDDFKKFLAVSPSLWWDEQHLVKRSAEVSAGSLAGIHLYSGTGEHENDVDKMWPPIPDELKDVVRGSQLDSAMVSTANEFATNLSNGSGIHLSQEIIADEHHSTIWGAAVTRGLVELYGRS